MAVAYQTVSSGTAGTDDSAEIAAAAGVVIGNLLLPYVLVRSTTTRRTASTPASLAFVASALDPTDAWTDLYVYWRIADGTANDTPTVTLSGSPTGWNTRLLRISGHDPVTPIQTSATANDANATDTAEIPVATVARDGSLAICFAAKLGSTNVDIVWPSPWSDAEIFDGHSVSGYASNVGAAWTAVDAGEMASGQMISGWDTTAQTVQRVTVIVQPPAAVGGLPELLNHYYMG